MCLYAAAVCCRECYRIKKSNVLKGKFQIQALKELEAYKNSETLFLEEECADDVIEGIFERAQEWSEMCLQCEGDMPMIYNKVMEFIGANQKPKKTHASKSGKITQRGNVIFFPFKQGK